jgi:hypothetical protein
MQSKLEEERHAELAQSHYDKMKGTIGLAQQQGLPPPDARHQPNGGGYRGISSEQTIRLYAEDDEPGAALPSLLMMEQDKDGRRRHPAANNGNDGSSGVTSVVDRHENYAEDDASSWEPWLPSISSRKESGVAKMDCDACHGCSHVLFPPIPYFRGFNFTFKALPLERRGMRVSNPREDIHLIVESLLRRRR